ncbi:hypothetical protein SISSUDRAFT_443523 [Sistotremastrum suecicum HHB10207 ss-3]|uniref:Uncharacterized protein n=1 Tax=Sistotremastrum suecicum HHB10207 ss-3 TaxID=1314776 RepID=A0A165YCE2_9AGAM|nr:hypothetical protein SISSUDRAFT_443523 [Sistotremastrum suecicum HHB10207 ss-3]
MKRSDSPFSRFSKRFSPLSLGQYVRVSSALITNHPYLPSSRCTFLRQCQFHRFFATYIAFDAKTCPKTCPQEPRYPTIIASPPCPQEAVSSISDLPADTYQANISRPHRLYTSVSFLASRNEFENITFFSNFLLHFWAEKAAQKYIVVMPQKCHVLVQFSHAFPAPRMNRFLTHFSPDIWCTQIV